MDLQTLQRVWRHAETYSGEAARALWNQRACSFSRKQLPTLESSPFLQQIAGCIPLDGSMTALDIGCGSGIYALALAPLLRKAAGCDVSDRMIAAAERRAADLGISNASFFCMDWETADLDALGWRRRFDLVFAHMTPAIHSYCALDQMTACAGRHCFLKRPARRRDLVLDQAMELLGLRTRGQDADESMEYVFCYLWRNGFEPQFRYGHECWQEDRPLEEALEWCLGSAALQRPLTDRECREVRSFLERIAVDGRIRESVSTTTVTIDWAVS